MPVYKLDGLLLEAMSNSSGITQVRTPEEVRITRDAIEAAFAYIRRHGRDYSQAAFAFYAFRRGMDRLKGLPVSPIAQQYYRQLEALMDEIMKSE